MSRILTICLFALARILAAQTLEPSPVQTPEPSLAQTPKLSPDELTTARTDYAAAVETVQTVYRTELQKLRERAVADQQPEMVKTIDRELQKLEGDAPKPIPIGTGPRAEKLYEIARLRQAIQSRLTKLSEELQKIPTKRRASSAKAARLRKEQSALQTQLLELAQQEAAPVAQKPPVVEKIAAMKRGTRESRK